MKKIIVAVIIMLTMAIFAGCADINVPDDPESTEAAETAGITAEKYSGPYSETDGAYGGTDDLGRSLSLDGEAPAEREKTVGIFYFLWQGQHGTSGPYDNYKIVQENPDAITSEKAWLAAGGGNQGAHHFWGEPLFGYYTSNDTWVMRKHCQMLTDAGVDYICFDVTNGFTYTAQVKKLIKVWYEYLEAGYDVPKLTFYTHSGSGSVINDLYKSLYNNKKLNNEYPRLAELWFNYEGKPMVIGNSSDGDLSDEAKAYFRIKADVWPNSYSNISDDAIPWMEFGRLLSDDAVYGQNGKKEVVNVSIAQHNVTCMMSASAWYGYEDRTRSWHDGANDKSEDAVLYGYNFAEQWEWAISVDPDMVFVTGWNEWVAQRQAANSIGSIVFIDCCDPNTSRDAEPMNGLFGDNYYMQLMDYIRKYKGVADRVNVGENIEIDITGSFDQWDNPAITAKYTDYANDTVNRSCKGFGNIKYTDETGRNDFVSIKTAKNADTLYFYAECSENITSSTDDNWMTLFINSGVEGNSLWANNFDFAVNLEKPSGNEVVISKYNSDGSWTKVGTGKMKVEGTKIMIEVSRNILGNAGDNTVLDLQFKWADNYQKNEDGSLDVFSFYKNGDAAPFGRTTYVYSEKING